jgi:hypothetical protein
MERPRQKTALKRSRKTALLRRKKMLEKLDRAERVFREAERKRHDEYRSLQPKVTILNLDVLHAELSVMAWDEHPGSDEVGFRENLNVRSLTIRS